MAEEQAKKMQISAVAAPLNSALNAQRYLGAKAPDKRKVSQLIIPAKRGRTDENQRQVRKVSDKKFVFDWDRADDTGADEVDPIYAPYIPTAAPTKDKNGRDGDRGGRSEQGGSAYGIKPRGESSVIVNAEAMKGKVGMYGRGMLAGFDREMRLVISSRRSLFYI